MRRTLILVVLVVSAVLATMAPSAGASRITGVGCLSGYFKTSVTPKSVQYDKNKDGYVCQASSRSKTPQFTDNIY